MIARPAIGCRLLYENENDFLPEDIEKKTNLILRILSGHSEPTVPVRLPINCMITACPSVRDRFAIICNSWMSAG